MILGENEFIALHKYTNNKKVLMSFILTILMEFNVRTSVFIYECECEFYL